jgi:hypothetical protein
VRGTCLDENAAVSFLERRISVGRIREVEAHLDACASCRKLLSEFAHFYVTPSGDVVTPRDSVGFAPTEVSVRQPASSPGGTRELPRGTNVGRYVLLDVLGAGGMGVVYAAYDPDLDRKVALKMMRRGIETEELKTRQLREAQAMARLNHANVIAIYDYGSHGGDVFIVMELVDGTTLAEWLAAAPRSRAEIMVRFLAAGRGLAAAHALGLVHRDFKPQNVLIGSDSSVRVSDFGLVCAEGAEPAVPVEPGIASSDAFDGGLTVRGALMGTPTYMAPEQHGGEPATASTDQFAFCVALWEALYGQRPFAGTTLPALARATRAGKIDEPPDGAGVPAWIRRTVARGLSSAPSERHPSMEALLQALAKDPARRLRRIALAVGAIAVIAVVIAGYGAYATVRIRHAPRARMRRARWRARARSEPWRACGTTIVVRRSSGHFARAGFRSPIACGAASPGSSTRTPRAGPSRAPRRAKTRAFAERSRSSYSTSG